MSFVMDTWHASLDLQGEVAESGGGREANLQQEEKHRGGARLGEQEESVKIASPALLRSL